MDKNYICFKGIRKRIAILKSDTHNEIMNTERIFNKNYILLMAVNTLLFISFNLINPVLPEHITSLGMNVTHAGIICGCFSITALVFRPLSGIAADRYNLKWLYVIAGIGIVVVSILYAFSESFGTFFIVRIFHGIFFAIDSTISLALVVEFIPKGKMGEGIGLFGIGPIIAIAFAPGMGIELSRMYGSEVSFFVSAVMSLAATICLLGISYQKKHNESDDAKITDEKGKKPKLKLKRQFSIKSFIATEIIIFTVLSGLFSFANSIEYTFMSLYSQSKGIEDISLYFTVSAIFILISRLFIGKIYDKRGLPLILFPAFAICAVSMIVLGSASCLAIFLIAAALKALGQGAGQPSLQSHCMESVRKERVGLASSTYYLGPDIMQGLGPVIGGFVIDHLGYESVYYLCSILLLLGIVIFGVYMGISKKNNHNKNERN